MASYADRPERNNSKLAKVIRRARDSGIPAIFWNREDGVHFDRFIRSAQLFEHILTVDENMLSNYRQVVSNDTTTNVMMFAAQTSIHCPLDIKPINRASFVGSYGTHVHPSRKLWQDMIFEAASEIGITVHDRNSDRKPEHYRYPISPWINLKSAIPYHATADVYRHHAVNINVNTIVDSPTAFSRRLVEIIACSAFAVTNRTPAVEGYFKDYCRIIDGPEDAKEVFNRIARDGLSVEDKDRAKAGAAYVLENHSWRHRLAQILDIIA